VPLRQLLVPEPLCWFRLGIADRPLVRVGQRVQVGDPLLERVRDPHVADVPFVRGMEPLEPLSGVERPAAESTGLRPTVPAMGPGRLIQARPGGRARAAMGRVAEPVHASVTGTVEVVQPGAIAVRAEGTGLAGVVGHGDTVSGRLLLPAGGPNAELRATAVDVQGAGAILVAGAALDIETLTRARATGVAGIVTGGVAGKDLAILAAADLRQRASLHPTTGFAVLVLDGYGRRPIPGAAWAWLAAAEGTEVAIVTDPPMLVIGPGVERPELTDHVRITAGDALGAEGRLLGAVGQSRGSAGVYRPAARVLAAVGDEPPSEHVVAFADLERVE
jgi:hypothetical protein